MKRVTGYQIFKFIGIVILVLISVVLVIAILILPVYFDVNLLGYYATILALIAPVFWKPISNYLNKTAEKEKKIPLLSVKIQEIMTEEYENLKYELKAKYFCYDENALNGDYNPLGNTPFLNALANAFCVVELQNMNKDYGIPSLSIFIDGIEFLNNTFIKPNENYKFILGFHYKIFKEMVSKEKDVCVVYQYKSVDMDQTFQQTSHFLFFFQESQPTIKILDPQISERKVIK